MSPYTPQSSLLSPGRIGQARWTQALGQRIPMTEAAVIADLYHRFAPGHRINPDLALAQFCEETGWGTSDRWQQQHNPCGLGITSDDVAGHDFEKPSVGIAAHLHHLCCYAYSATECPVNHGYSPDFRHTFHDANPALSHLQDDTRKWATKPEYVSRILAIVNRLLPQERPMGHVPKPPIDDLIAATMKKKVEGVGFNTISRNRIPRGTVLHSMAGTLNGTTGYFALPTTAALTDFGIGQVDHNNSGYARIVQYCDYRGRIEPWASGPVKVPEGDGPAYLAKFGGADGLNETGVAIEHDDTTRENGSIGPVGGVPATVYQWSATCWLQAWLHAEEIEPHQTAETFEWSMWHREFTGAAYKTCPNPRITDHVTEYQAAVKAIMRHWQEGVPYPAGGVIVAGLRLNVPTQSDWQPTPSRLPSPIVTPQQEWGPGSKGRIISLELTAVNDEDYPPPGKYFAAKKEFQADGTVTQTPWVEV